MKECGCDEATLRCVHIDGTEVLRLYDHSVHNFFNYRNRLTPRYSVVSIDGYVLKTPFIAAAQRIYDSRERRLRA